MAVKMKGSRRAYSLVGVLSAAVLLMAVLLPMMRLQGRVLEKWVPLAKMENVEQIESDWRTLIQERSPIERSWSVGGKEFQRKVVKEREGLLRISYQVTSKSGQVLVRLERFIPNHARN